jgi:hypothetical protein
MFCQRPILREEFDSKPSGRFSRMHLGRAATPCSATSAIRASNANAGQQQFRDFGARKLPSLLRPFGIGRDLCQSGFTILRLAFCGNMPQNVILPHLDALVCLRPPKWKR